MRDPADWGEVDVSADPLLVVGERPRPRHLAGHVVDTRADAHGILRDVAERALEALTQAEPVAWEPEAAIEEGEQYFVLDAPDLLQAASRGSEVAPELDEASDLLRLLLHLPDIEGIHPERLDVGRFLFYAIAFEEGDGGEPISFLRKWDPTSPLRGARAWFRFDGALEPAPSPDFVVQDQVDLVVTTSEIAILRPSAFNFLFSDIRTLLADVPRTVTRLSRRMRGLHMTSATRAALEEACRGKPSFARRLHLLAESDAVATITADSLRAVLRHHDEEPGDFLVRGELDISADQVPTLLDVAEGRWYSADFTGERRRADRYRRR
jgi:hypothetical protein